MTSLPSKLGDPGGAGRLEMIDAPRAELDGERDRTRFGELIPMQSQGEPGVSARLQVAPRLRRVERTALEEDVRRLGNPHDLRQHLGEGEVEVLVRAGELRRHRVSPEPGRDTAGRLDSSQGGDLGLEVEPVARFALEGRRSGGEHPVAVALDALGRPSRPSARVARTVELIPPPAACSSS